MSIRVLLQDSGAVEPGRARRDVDVDVDCVDPPAQSLHGRRVRGRLVDCPASATRHGGDRRPESRIELDAAVQSRVESFDETARSSFRTCLNARGVTAVQARLGLPVQRCRRRAAGGGFNV